MSIYTRNHIFVGKPKFKITETGYGDGYSVYIGYGNNKYIRLNYGEVPSIDINVLNHKGSIELKKLHRFQRYGKNFSFPDTILPHKYRVHLNNISLLNCTYIIEYFLGAALTIEGDISEHHPCLWCYVDGKMKMNLSFEDKFVLDISIINDAKIKTYLNFPSARIRGTVYKSP